MTTLQITLNLPYARHQLAQLRGLVAERAGLQHDLLHNHRDGRKDQYHYRYPLVQYKIVKGQPVVLGLNAGATLLRSLFDAETMRLAGDLPVSAYREESFALRMTDRPRRYLLRQWLALNEGNYARWQALDNAEARRTELERILAAHLLAFAEGVGFTVPRPRGLEVSLESVEAPRRVRCHDGRLLSFDVIFRANMTLPPDIGIGKSASHGFGTAFPIPDRVRPDRPAGMVQTQARQLEMEAAL